ncbi:MAG: hypothetical protein KJ799_01385 [Bacteroidetes bacterium]|nr:hypothetical protein [Bacteroidota bacterium]
MKMKSKLYLGLALVFLLLTFAVPIWNIDLEAPQYPEGIGLRIWINQISGANENDLQNINKLNHYIGMKTIEPESIPELTIMPYIIIFFVVFGLVIIFLNKPKLIPIWLVLLTVCLIAGLYDFYIWEYDYGHNLDTKAAIKIPGMNYQPPLIGSKQLLNMKTTSLPAAGSFLIMISFVTFLAVYIYELRKGASNAETK